MTGSEHLMSTYAPMPVCFERGEGAILHDDQGKQYLDALAGIAVCGLGHAHPAVTEAINNQAARLLHTSNLYCIKRQQELADRLAASVKATVVAGSTLDENNLASNSVIVLGGLGVNTVHSYLQTPDGVLVESDRFTINNVEYADSGHAAFAV